ncbi:ATP/GTP-binding protein [Streptomyces sp. NPDC056160]|uniref:GTP-binding protein n=1 Tax=Streptomyces sp. NPDC056160 TaxID=3345731 RepID=UPI0035DCDD6B
MPVPTLRPADPVQPPGTQRLLPLKIVIAGGFGVGKTTAVAAVSEIKPLSTEEYLTEPGAGVDDLTGLQDKDTTTVALDFGRLSLPDAPIPLELFLFGVPGQDRFVGLLWEDLARGAVGAIVLVDTRRLDISFSAVTYYEHLGLPFIVAVNEFDGAHRYELEQIRDALGLPGRVPVIALDARDPVQVASTLLTLVDHASASASASLQDAR